MDTPEPDTALLRMLIVDDDDVDRERVRRLLVRSPLQADIKEAASGAEALAMVRQHPFDCVMLDNQLGDASGTELLPQLHREASRACPIIMVTGAGSEALAVQAMQDGASDYLAKARLSVDALVRSVRRSIEDHRLRGELQAMHQQLEARVEQQAATIRQRERDLRALIDNAPTVMGYWDQLQHCRFGNQTHGEWFGLDPAQLQGRHLREVLGDALHTDLGPHIAAALMGETQHFERTLPAKGLRPARHVQAQLRPDVADSGDVLGFYATLTDVSDIKGAQARAEELLRFSDAVIAHSPIGIAVFRASGPRVLANAAFTEAFAPALSEDAAQHLLRCTPWRECGLVAEALATLADGQSRRIEINLPTPGAALPDAQLACGLARVDRGGEPHLLLIARDISEQRRAHAALVAARDAAESAARAKSAFLANMSHEIRTPMNAIVGLSRLAQEEELPPRGRGYVDQVHNAAVALMGLLDDILDHAKIEAGHLDFEHIPVVLDEVLARLAALFEPRMQQKALAFSVHVAREVPARVMGDPLRLGQVLSNLVGNAVKFTAAGRITVQVSTTTTPQLLRFSVSDTGMGISPEQQGRLFAAFEQGDGSVTRRFGGTGLGLTICKRLVEIMGGEIGIHSTPGQGSEFWFTARLDAAVDAAPDDAAADKHAPPLPAIAPVPGLVQRAPNAPTPDPARARSEALMALAQPLRGAHILLAEDNRLNQIVAEEFLRRTGLTVTVVDDGEAAVAVMRESAPDTFAAVLMDLHMPVMDGLEATRHIRALPQGRELPIIGMTAAALPEDRAACMEAGMVGHIPKPVIPEHLIRVLLEFVPQRLAASAGAAPPEGAASAARPGPKPDPAVLDLESLFARLHGNQTLAWKLLTIFVGYEAESASALRAMLARGDTEGARRKAHDLKGTAANLGANALSAAGAALESALKQGQGVDAAMARFERDFPTGMDTIREALAMRPPRAQ
jgi:PAS domain S-box-containing protein